MLRVVVVLGVCGALLGCGSDSDSGPGTSGGAASGGSAGFSAGSGGGGAPSNGGSSNVSGAAGSVAGGSSCGPLGNDCSDPACVAPTYECLATSGLNVCQLKNRYVGGLLCSGNDCPTEHPTCLLYKEESGGICVTNAELACACASKNKATYMNCPQ